MIQNERGSWQERFDLIVIGAKQCMCSFLESQPDLPAEDVSSSARIFHPPSPSHRFTMPSLLHRLHHKHSTSSSASTSPPSSPKLEACRPPRRRPLRQQPRRPSLRPRPPRHLPLPRPEHPSRASSEPPPSARADHPYLTASRRTVERAGRRRLARLSSARPAGRVAKVGA
jgi:hypothetical protein